MAVKPKRFKWSTHASTQKIKKSVEEYRSSSYRCAHRARPVQKQTEQLYLVPKPTGGPREHWMSQTSQAHKPYFLVWVILHQQYLCKTKHKLLYLNFYFGSALLACFCTYLLKNTSKLHWDSYHKFSTTSQRRMRNDRKESWWVSCWISSLGQINLLSLLRSILHILYVLYLHKPADNQTLAL